ncbi:MAG: hypothetical protein KF809_06215 [Chloroflexi bacterium]|nr:hypothetical protein [Chloroflexota bacterium]
MSGQPPTASVSENPRSTSPEPGPARTSAAAEPTTRPLTWFAPLPAHTPHMGYGGSVDYDDLWAPDAPWTTAQEHVQVFRIYSSWVMNYATADQLRRLVGGVRERGLALALEIGILSDSVGCGTGIEGFDFGLEPFWRIEAAGGHVDIVVFDESWAFASERFDTPNACRWPTDEIARRTVPFIRQLREYAPDIVIGDTEPLWTDVSPEALLEWADAYAAATGEPLDFLHVDIDWEGRPDWPTLVRQIEEGTRERGIEFGLIYNGGHATSDAEWVDRALQRAFTYEELHGGRPDHVVLQSWMDHPDRTLPESDPTTFTGFIDRYFAPRTRIGATITRDPAGHLALTASLATADGTPIEDAPLTARMLPVGAARQVLRMSGQVPEDARAAIVGIRVNTEGAEPGRTDLRIYRVRFTVAGSTTDLVRNGRFTRRGPDWHISGSGRASIVSSDIGDGRMLRLRAARDEDLFVDHPAFAVTPGSAYTLEVRTGIGTRSVGTAYAAVMWLRGTEVGRDRLPLAPQPVELPSRLTDALGTATFEPALVPDATRYLLTVGYVGSADHWPAYVERPLEMGGRRGAVDRGVSRVTDAGHSLGAPATDRGPREAYSRPVSW